MVPANSPVPSVLSGAAASGLIMNTDAGGYGFDDVGLGAVPSSVHDGYGFGGAAAGASRSTASVPFGAAAGVARLMRNFLALGFVVIKLFGLFQGVEDM